ALTRDDAVNAPVVGHAASAADDDWPRAGVHVVIAGGSAPVAMPVPEEPHAEAMAAHAAALAALGDDVAAERWWRRAVRASRETTSPGGLADRLFLPGVVLARPDRPAEAAAAWRRCA